MSRGVKEGVEKERVVYAGGKRGGMKGRMLGEREKRGRREGGGQCWERRYAVLSVFAIHGRCA